MVLVLLFLYIDIAAAQKQKPIVANVQQAVRRNYRSSRAAVPQSETYRFNDDDESSNFRRLMKKVQKRRFTTKRAKMVARLIAEDLCWHATGGRPVPASADIFYEGMYTCDVLLKINELT